MTPTAALNISRVLHHLGLGKSVVITEAHEDRVFAWPVDDSLMRHVVLHEWPQDPKRSVEHYHGGRISFREPGGVRPALQAVFHPASEGSPWLYFVELDMDEAAPNTMLGLIRHGWEVLRNTITGSKTDQAKIARMLDERFGMWEEDYVGTQA